MLNKCYEIIGELGLTFNCDKSCCIAFGPRYRYDLPGMHLGQKILTWNEKIKYLGMTFMSSKTMNVDVDCISRKFYAASNCIFNNTSGLDEIL